MRRRLAVLALVVVLVAGLSLWWLLRPVQSDYARITGEAFATHYHITYRYGPDADMLQQAVDAELHRIDAMASTWKSDSELMRYNRSDQPDEFKLSPELAELLKRAEEIEIQTVGAFSLRPDGETIDLSGIAKGYAVDRVVELLQRDFGIEDGLVDIGGEVRAIGDGPTGNGWRVGLYMPNEASENDTPVLQLHDASVATSGAYFKGNHIIDPDSGQPVENDLVSASVVHASNTTADALATALYVMGSQRGVEWAQANGVRVIFLLKDGSRREYPPE